MLLWTENCLPVDWKLFTCGLQVVYLWIGSLHVDIKLFTCGQETVYLRTGSCLPEDIKLFTCGQEVVKVFLQTTGEVDQGSTAGGDNQDTLLVVLYGAKDHLQRRLSQGYLPTKTLTISPSLSIYPYLSIIHQSFYLSLYYSSIHLFIDFF